MQPRASQLREDFALDRDLAAGGNHLKYLGLEQVCPGVNQPRFLLARRWLLLEADTGAYDGEDLEEEAELLAERYDIDIEDARIMAKYGKED
jgi:hypothetical protein